MPSPAPDDPGVHLMLAFQSGDATAFDTLIHRYSNQVFALLTRFLGHHPNREDLVQETFLRVLRARDRYEPTARFSTFLYRIVFNLAVNETQRRTPRTTHETETDTPLLDLADTSTAAPSHDLEQRDIITAVRRAIAALPENQRMALILAKYEELPYTEIADVLGTSEKAVKSLVHRARETLRIELAPFLQEELA